MVLSMANGARTFIKITNKDIYDKLELLEQKLNLLEKKTDAVNAKVGGHKLLIYGLFSVMSLIIGILITHVMAVG